MVSTPNYIPFTPQQLSDAKRTDLAAFLESRGETLKRCCPASWRLGWEGRTIRCCRQGTQASRRAGQPAGVRRSVWTAFWGIT